MDVSLYSETINQSLKKGMSTPMLSAEDALCILLGQGKRNIIGKKM